MGKTKLDVAAAKLAGTNASAGAAVHAEIGLMYILPGRACGRACDPCGEGGATSSDFALAGSGIALYFILEKALVWLFVLYTIALAPNMILNTGGSLRGGIGLSTLSQTMLGQISNSSGLAFARISGAVAPLPAEHVPAIYSIVDILGCLLFSAGVLYLMGFMDRLKSEASARSVGTEDYTIQVSGLERLTLCGCGGPQGCACGLCAASAMTPDLLAAHFEKVARTFTSDYQVVRSLNGRPEVHLAGADLRALRLFRKRAVLLAALQQAQQRLLPLEKSIGIKKGSVWIRKKPRYLRILREFLDHASAHRERVLSARLAEVDRQGEVAEVQASVGSSGRRGHASSHSGGADSDSDDSEAAGRQGGSTVRTPASLPSSRRRMPSSRMATSSGDSASASDPASSARDASRTGPAADSGGTPSRGRGSLSAPGGVVPPRSSSFKQKGRRGSGKDVAVLDLADLLSGQAGVMARARTAEQEYAAHEARLAQIAATSIPDIPLRPAPSPTTASTAAGAGGAPTTPRGAARAGSDSSDDESAATSSLASTQSADDVYADLEDEGQEGKASAPSRGRHSSTGASKDPNRNVTVRARRRASSNSLSAAVPDLSGPPPEDDIPPLEEPTDYVRKASGMACQPCCLSRSAAAEWKVQQTRRRIDDLLYDIESLTRSLTRYTSRQEVEEEFDRQRARAQAQAQASSGAAGEAQKGVGAGPQKAAGFFGWFSSRNVVSEKQEKTTLSLHLSSRALTAGPAVGDNAAHTASRPMPVKDSRPSHRQIVRDPMVAYVTFESAETAAAMLQLYSIGSLELLCRNGRALVLPPRDREGSRSGSSSSARGHSSQSLQGQPHTAVVVAAKQGRRGEGAAGRDTKMIVRSSQDEEEEGEEESGSSESEADRKGEKRTAGQRRSVSSKASKAASEVGDSDSDRSSEDDESDSSEQGGGGQALSANTTLERVNLRFMGQTLRVTRAPPPDTVLWMNLYTSSCERLLRRAFAFIVSASIILGSFAVLYGAQVLTDEGRQLQGTQESAMCSYLSLAETAGLVTYQGSVWARLPAGRALSLGALDGLTGESASPQGLLSVNASQYLLEAAPRLAQGPNASCPSTGYSAAIWQSRPEASSAPAPSAYVPWATLLNATRSTCGAFLNASDALALLLALDSPSMPPTVVSVAREPLLVALPASVRSCYCSALFFTRPTQLLPANTQDFLARVQALLAAKPAVRAGAATNMTVLRNGTFELVPSTDAPPVEAAPLDTCASWLLLYSGYSGLLGLAALVVVLTNSGVLLFLERTVEWDRYNSYETERISLLLRSLAMQFLNTALLALLVSANIPTIPVATPGQRYADFTPQWYVNRGPGIVLTMVLQALVPHLQRVLEAVLWRCRRSCGATGGAQSQAQLNSFYTGPDFPLSQRYAENLTVVFVCLFYGTGIPVLILVAAAHFLLGYVTDLLLFLFYYKRPPKEDMRVGRIALGLIPVAILLHLLLGGWMLSSSAVYAVSGGSTLGSYGIIPGMEQALDLAEGWLRPTPPAAPALNCTAYYLNSSSADLFTAAACNGTQWWASSNSTNSSNTTMALVSATASATATPSSIFSTASPSGSASASATGTSSAAASASAASSVSSAATASATASARSSVSATATVGTVRRLLQAEASPPQVSTAPPRPPVRPRVLPVSALQLPPAFTNGTRPGLPTLSDIQGYVSGYVDLASLAAAGLVDYSAETLVAILQRFRVPYVLPFGLFALSWFLFLFLRQLWLVLLAPLLWRLLACCAVPRKICRFCCMSCWNPRSGCCWLAWLYCCACGRAEEAGQGEGGGKAAARGNKAKEAGSRKGGRRACQLSCSTQCCGGSQDDSTSPSEIRVAAPAVDTGRGDLAGFNPPMKWLSIVAARKIEAGKLPDLGAVVKHMLEGNDGVPDAESVGFSRSMVAAERRARRGGCCLCLCKTLCCCFVCCFPALFGWDLHKEDSTGSKGKAKEGKKSKELLVAPRGGAAKGGSASTPAADSHAAGTGGPTKQRACCRFYFCGGFIDCGRKRYRAGDVSEDRRFAYVPSPSFSQALALRLLSDTPTYNVLASRRVLDALFPASEQAMLFGRYSTLTQAALFAPLDPHEDPNAPGPEDGDEVELKAASDAGKGRKGKKRRASRE